MSSAPTSTQIAVAVEPLQAALDAGIGQRIRLQRHALSMAADQAEHGGCAGRGGLFGTLTGEIPDRPHSARHLYGTASSVTALPCPEPQSHGVGGYHDDYSLLIRTAIFLSLLLIILMIIIIFIIAIIIRVVIVAAAEAAYFSCSITASSG